MEITVLSSLPIFRRLLALRIEQSFRWSLAVNFTLTI